jgi:hypothetical protein
VSAQGILYGICHSSIDHSSIDAQREDPIEFQDIVAIDHRNGHLLSRSRIKLRGRVAIAVTADGQILAIVDYARLRLLDTRTMEEIVSVANPSPVNADISFSRDGAVLAASGQHGQLVVWKR